MTVTQPANPDIPAGWYPDPATPQQQRFWGGTSWTHHTQPYPNTSTDTPQLPHDTAAEPGMHQIRATREAEIRRRFEGTKHQKLMERDWGRYYVRRAVRAHSSPVEAWLSAVVMFVFTILYVGASDNGWAVFKTPALYDPKGLVLAILGWMVAGQAVKIVRSTVGKHRAAVIPAAAVTATLVLLAAVRNIVFAAAAGLASVAVARLIARAQTTHRNRATQPRTQ